MNLLRRALLLCLSAALLPLLTACHDDDEADIVIDFEPTNVETYTYKIAVIMPGSQMYRWKRIVDWAIDYLTRAQDESGIMKRKVALDLEWYDEDQEEGLTEFVSRVDADPEYKAIIGPMRTEHAYTVATLCEKHHKTLLLPQCTSTEVQRIFAESPNVFNLTQSDIGQVEMMVSLALSNRAPSISLLVHCEDVTSAKSQRSYGSTFRNWVGFMASEAGLPVDTVCLYEDDATLQQAVSGIADYYSRNDTASLSAERSVLLFVPEKPEELIAYDRFMRQYTSMAGCESSYPFTFCSSSVVSDVVAGANLGDGYEGIDISPAATSGFIPAYKALYGPSEYPVGGEAQLFDALYLLTCALLYNPNDVSGSIIAITDDDTYEQSPEYASSLFPADIGLTLGMISMRIMVPVSGALGRWKFDSRYHASLLSTTYSHWRLNHNAFFTLQYMTLGKSRRAVSNEQLWQMNAHVTEDFSQYEYDYSYTEQKGNYAVIVAASTGWHNYRHQADALNMYQMLKQHGYDDDHILLIWEGDIVDDEHNLHPGEVRVKPDGDNLYHDVKVDYHTSALKPDDLSNILTGNVTERTPVVLQSSSKDNVLFFWSGHGNEGVFYLDRYNCMNRQMQATLNSMYEERKYRKMFFVVEACYSGSVAEYCKGVPGVLMLTAANGSETSLADVLDPEMNIWLSNGFTRSFCEAVERNNNISMRDLYYYVAQQTVGSHATMYNYEMYGNMFTNTVKEFFP